MDDILVYSDTRDQHVKHVKMVLDALKQKKLKIKPEKCKFHVNEITFLGFVITLGNIQMETTKMDNIQIWPAPKNIKDLQKLLGFLKFYQNMIPKYAEWTSSMTNFLQFFFWMGTKSDVGIGKIEKIFRHQQTINKSQRCDGRNGQTRIVKNYDQYCGQNWWPVTWQVCRQKNMVQIYPKK